MIQLAFWFWTQTKLMEKIQDSVEQSSSDRKMKFIDFHD